MTNKSTAVPLGSGQPRPFGNLSLVSYEFNLHWNCGCVASELICLLNWPDSVTSVRANLNHYSIYGEVFMAGGYQMFLRLVALLLYRGFVVFT